jgi:hypothetical protein
MTKKYSSNYSDENSTNSDGVFYLDSSDESIEEAVELAKEAGFSKDTDIIYSFTSSGTRRDIEKKLEGYSW